MYRCVSGCWYLHYVSVRMCVSGRRGREWCCPRRIAWDRPLRIHRVTCCLAHSLCAAWAQGIFEVGSNGHRQNSHGGRRGERRKDIRLEGGEGREGGQQKEVTRYNQQKVPLVASSSPYLNLATLGH